MVNWKPSLAATEAHVRSITEIIKHFKQNWTEELSGDSIAKACRDAGMTWLDSMLNPVVTVQIFMIQILHGNTACQHMPHLCEMAFTAAGYCKARMRIKLEVFEFLLSRCVGSIQQQTLDAGRWLGHRVFMVDGGQASQCLTQLLCRTTLVNTRRRNQVADFQQLIGWGCCTWAQA